MADMKTSDTVLIHRIISARNGKDIDNLKYDLPQDRVTQALAKALASALDDLAHALPVLDELDPTVVD